MKLTFRAEVLYALFIGILGFIYTLYIYICRNKLTFYTQCYMDNYSILDEKNFLKAQLYTSLATGLLIMLICIICAIYYFHHPHPSPYPLLYWKLSLLPLLVHVSPYILIRYSIAKKYIVSTNA